MKLNEISHWQPICFQVNTLTQHKEKKPLVMVDNKFYLKKFLKKNLLAMLELKNAAHVNSNHRYS